MRKRFYILMIGGFMVSPAAASSLVYTPTNPTFGGNPLNGTFLLSTAQAQGKGASSGSNSPDLSGLESALNNLGSVVVVGGTTTNPTTPASP